MVDAVGTLIEPVPAVAEVYAGVARRQGVMLDPAEVKARFQLRFRTDELDELGGALRTDETREQLRWQRIVAGVLPELPEPERAFRELWKHFGQPQAWRCFDDVAPAFHALQSAGVRVWVASNFDARLRSVLEGLSPLADWADRLVISSEVGYRKPHPAFYQAGCARLELEPAEVVCVGDDLENDLQGPKRAGLHGLLLDRQAGAPCIYPIFSSLSELASHILTGMAATF